MRWDKWFRRHTNLDGSILEVDDQRRGRQGRAQAHTEQEHHRAELDRIRSKPFSIQGERVEYHSDSDRARSPWKSP